MSSQRIHSSSILQRTKRYFGTVVEATSKFARVFGFHVVCGFYAILVHRIVRADLVAENGCEV